MHMKTPSNNITPAAAASTAAADAATSSAAADAAPSSVPAFDDNVPLQPPPCSGDIHMNNDDFWALIDTNTTASQDDAIDKMLLGAGDGVNLGLPEATEEQIALADMGVANQNQIQNDGRDLAAGNLRLEATDVNLGTANENLEIASDGVNCDLGQGLEATEERHGPLHESAETADAPQTASSTGHKEKRKKFLVEASRAGCIVRELRYEDIVLILMAAYEKYNDVRKMVNFALHFGKRAIYIHNLPKNAEPINVKDRFGFFGNIIDVQIATGLSQPMRIGVILFETSESAEKAAHYGGRTSMFLQNQINWHGGLESCSVCQHFKHVLY